MISVGVPKITAYFSSSFVVNATLAPSFAFLTVAVTVNFLSNSTVVDEALTEIDGSDGLAVGLAGVRVLSLGSTICSALPSASIALTVVETLFTELL